MKQRGDVQHTNLGSLLRNVLDFITAKGTGLSIDCDLEVRGDLSVQGNADLTGKLPWGDVDKTGSNLTDIATRSHTSLTDIGTNTHAQIDTFIAKFPAGLIMMYGGAAAPTGWLLCDGASLLRASYSDLFTAIGTTFGSVDGTHFNVPDMRGIFARGAGTNGTLTNANGTAFAGTLGTYQDDKMQGHRFWNGAAVYDNYTPIYGKTSTDASTADMVHLLGAQYARNYQSYTSLPKTDGSNGTPRTGTETNPANLSLTYIIKT